MNLLSKAYPCAVRKLFSNPDILVGSGNNQKINLRGGIHTNDVLMIKLGEFANEKPIGFKHLQLGLNLSAHCGAAVNQQLTKRKHEIMLPVFDVDPLGTRT